MFKEALERFEQLEKTLPANELEALASELLTRFEKEAAVNPSLGFLQNAAGLIGKKVGKAGASLGSRVDSLRSKLDLASAKAGARAAAKDVHRTSVLEKVHTETALRNRMAGKVRSGELPAPGTKPAKSPPTRSVKPSEPSQKLSPLKKGLIVGGAGLAAGVGVGSYLGAKRERQRQMQTNFYP